ncbi:N-formylglutamate deformylase [Caenimonas terrae]|uniref:N-formylglutamate deformylase n=1 Tax=Caenimonas terrae TaxID=696074 RepID=A0ABW0NJL8_9BURK
MSFTLHRGSSPLLVSIPHLGTEIPPELRPLYDPRALAVEDADWHLDRLYDFLPALGASVLQPRYARYVIDLNRPPDDTPMYPGASNTELCPTRFFNGDALYAEGRAPPAADLAARREQYWRPYHEALQAELARIRQQHGFVLLWDAHSIRSQIPWLFDGRLPDLNIGTADGASADASIAQAVVAAASASPAYSHVLNGRFKGGYITRRYGRPAEDVHAVQLEMCQSVYMQEAPPFAYLEPLARRVQPTLRSMVGGALDACKALYGR